jgi:hypothetical protein
MLSDIADGTSTQISRGLIVVAQADTTGRICHWPRNRSQATIAVARRGETGKAGHFP